MPEQPMPHGGQESVFDALIAALRQREQRGIETYHTTLMTFNGRDALRDAFEESCDQTLYLLQALMERDAAQENRP